MIYYRRGEVTAPVRCLPDLLDNGSAPLPGASNAWNAWYRGCGRYSEKFGGNTSTELIVVPVLRNYLIDYPYYFIEFNEFFYEVATGRYIDFSVPFGPIGDAVFSFMKMMMKPNPK